jgi:hypothetical protein
MKEENEDVTDEMDTHKTQQKVEKKRKKMQTHLIFVSHFYISIYQGIIIPYLLSTSTAEHRAWVTERVCSVLQ